MLVAGTARCAAMSADDFTDSRGRFAGIGEWWLEGRCSLRGRCALGEGRCSAIYRVVILLLLDPLHLLGFLDLLLGPLHRARWNHGLARNRPHAQTAAKSGAILARLASGDVLGAFRPPLAHRYSFAPFYTHIPEREHRWQTGGTGFPPPLGFPPVPGHRRRLLRTSELSGPPPLESRP
jgi:hypothetical protein